MLRDTGFHGRSHAQALVDTAEVVISQIQCNSALWFSIFLLKAFVYRVKRRSVRLNRSTCDVQVRSLSGLPLTGTCIAFIIGAGE